MSCEEVEGMLPALFDGAPDHDSALDLRLHLYTCHACRVLFAYMLLSRAMGQVLRRHWGKPLRHTTE